jgi:hypothetical protein
VVQCVVATLRPFRGEVIVAGLEVQPEHLRKAWPYSGHESHCWLGSVIDAQTSGRYGTAKSVYSRPSVPPGMVGHFAVTLVVKRVTPAAAHDQRHGMRRSCSCCCAVPHVGCQNWWVWGSHACCVPYASLFTDVANCCRLGWALLHAPQYSNVPEIFGVLIAGPQPGEQGRVLRGHSRQVSATKGSGACSGQEAPRQPARSLEGGVGARHQNERPCGSHANKRAKKFRVRPRSTYPQPQLGHVRFQERNAGCRLEAQRSSQAQDSCSRRCRENCGSE